MKVNPKSLRLYAVTDRAWTDGTDGLLRQVADAIDGGATMVQLREKHLDDAAFLEEAKAFVALCREKGAVSIINDRADIALESGADGVHVGQEDLAAAQARQLLGPDKIVGVSAHNVEEALAAQAAGADYLGVGAAFVTGTKADAKPISRDTIRAVTAAVEIPAVAIGGITRENVTELTGCGLAGVAVVSALFAQADVKAAAQELLGLVETIVK
jgi:thiamine-phosphate pyrophosphorylase